jgi:fatty acid desaturase
MQPLHAQSAAYERQLEKIRRRARERALWRYRVPAVLLFATGLGMSYWGHGPAAVALAVILGCAGVFLSNIDMRLRK